MNENNYVVYRHISPSGKVYIGITCRKPERRWNSGKGYKDSPKFYNAIQKYGWNSFKHEILYSSLNEISAKMIEEDLIYYYKSLNLSYNITDGGDGAKGYKPTEEVKKKISERTREAMKNPDIRKKISDTNKGHIAWNKGKHHSAETKQKMSKAKEKPVNQFSLDGNLIATYKSIKQAYDNTKINRSHIGSVCKGDRKTAGGFIWRFNKN